MEPENSLPLSQQLATFLRPEPVQSSHVYSISPIPAHPFYYYPQLSCFRNIPKANR
jgi:hypothetical protein